VILDRDPWAFQLYGLLASQLTRIGQSTLPASETLASAVLPLSFRLVAGPTRPQIEVLHSDGKQKWFV
jgi:hypothetical protein